MLSCHAVMPHGHACKINRPHSLSWRRSKLEDLAAISGAWWEIFSRWVLQVLLSEVWTIGILGRGMDSAFVVSEHS